MTKRTHFEFSTQTKKNDLETSKSFIGLSSGLML
jgi:hypothetical protein